MTAGGASTLIRGARAFEGQRLREAGSVLLAGGTIAGIGAGLALGPRNT